MVATDRILQDAIGIGDALVLTEMSEPGIQEERLEESPLLSSILEYAPLIRSIAAAFTPQVVECNEKSSASARIDSVFDCHQDGPAIVVERMESNRRWPMHRWRQIEFSAGLQFPPPRQRDPSECSGGGNKVRGGQPKQSRYMPPERAADGHNAEKNRQVERKAAAAQPFRQGNLSRDIEARQDRDPAGPVPAMTLATNAVAAFCATPNRRSATMVLKVPPATKRSGPRMRLSQGSANEPATAPAPIAPSMKP